MQPIQEADYGQNEDDYNNFNFATSAKARKEYNDQKKQMDTLLSNEQGNLPEGTDVKQHL